MSQASERDAPICSKCRMRPGVRKWATDGTAFAHGWIEYRCDVCALREMLAHAKERAERIPRFEAELKEAESSVGPVSASDPSQVGNPSEDPQRPSDAPAEAETVCEFCGGCGEEVLYGPPGMPCHSCKGSGVLPPSP